MKKLSYFLFTALAALAMIFSSLGTVTAFATTEQTYDIVLTKVKLSEDNLKNFPKGEGKDSYTGAKLDSRTYFGTEDTLPGVFFKVYQYSDSAADHIGAPAEGTVVEGKTDSNGQIRFTGLKEGKYIIVEDKTKSTIAGKEELANSKAVPLVVELPVYKAEGGTFTTGADALYVYPKNSVDEPKIDKVVNENDKHDTAQVGETKTFKITSTMPEGIADYKVLNFEDTFSKGLTYTGNLEVSVKSGGTTTKLTEGTHYSTTGTSPVNTKEATIKVDLKNYIASLKAGDVITITYNAVINEDAVMGAANPNNVKLTYGNNPNETKDKTPGENPELHTGGKRFVKKDKVSGDTLKDAIFELQGNDGTAIKWTAALIAANKAAIEAGQFSKTADTVTATSATVPPVAGETIYLLSDANGAFEIKGLAYGTVGQAANGTDSGSTDYQLVETKAPKDYSKLTAPVTFTVNAGSYQKDPTKISLGLADPDRVDNSKITIPQTGGIGSVAVIVAGLAIVGLGFIMKKRMAK